MACMCQRLLLDADFRPKQKQNLLVRISAFFLRKLIQEGLGLWRGAGAAPLSPGRGATRPCSRAQDIAVALGMRGYDNSMAAIVLEE